MDDMWDDFDETMIEAFDDKVFLFSFNTSVELTRADITLLAAVRCITYNYTQLDITL